MKKKPLKPAWPERIVAAVFPLLHRVNKQAANKVALALFTTPSRPAFIPGEREFLAKCTRYTLHVEGRNLAAYRMGTGPEVICVHGWAGRAAQFRYIAEAMVGAGFQFVAFDSPAHGQSSGRQTNMLEFSAAFKAVLAGCERPVAVVAHSLGVAAVGFYATQHRFELPLVSLAAPVLAEDILDAFRARIGAPRAVNEGLRTLVHLRLGRSFDSLTLQHTFAAVSTPVFAVHGTADTDIGHHHLDALRAINPAAKWMLVEGAGHRRILKDEAVLRAVVDFILPKDYHRAE